MTESKLIRVYIAEDIRYTLDITERLLKAYSDSLEVVGKATTVPDAISDISELLPDVAVVDINFNRRDMDGITVLETVKNKHKEVRFLMWTNYDVPEIPALAFKRGAEGFLFRAQTLGERLISAIRTIHSGGLMWDDEALRKAREWTYNFTAMERKIFVELAVYPGTSQELAERLKISPRSVETQIANIMDALDIHQKSQLIVWARDHLRLIQ